MSKLKLKKDDEIVILSLEGTDYIAVVSDSDPMYTIQPEDKTVYPSEELYTVTANEDVELDTGVYIMDSNSTRFTSIISPRPRNIVRR